MRSFNNILGIPLFINLNKRKRLLFITDQLINFFFFVMLVKLVNAFLATCNLYQFILSILASLNCKIHQLQILLVLLGLFIIMQDITKFFRSSSKKRDLSDTSKQTKIQRKYEKQALQVLQIRLCF